MDPEFVCGLDAAIDRSAFLRRTLTSAERAAQAFPKSAVIASFHARLLFVLGEYDAAERECRRALVMKEPDDPQHDCIPPGSISGENRGARLMSLACEFHELPSDYWNSMSSERQQDFLFVRLDVLQREYNKVDQLRAFTVSDVQSFVKEKGSWRYWVCPICVGNKKFLDTGLLLSHMCSKHPRAVLPRLQSVLDPNLTEKALEGDDSMDGLSFSQDSDQKDVITFDKRSDLFKWLFYAPSSGVGPKPFAEIRETKRHQGNMHLESIKERMKTLPADKSASEKELKKCMTEDQKAAAKFISSADIDAVFTKEEASIFTKEDDTDESLNIIESHEESEVHAADESSETTGNDPELSGPPVNITASVDDLDTRVKNLQIDPNSDGSITTSEASSRVVQFPSLPHPEGAGPLDARSSRTSNRLDHAHLVWPLFRSPARTSVVRGGRFTLRSPAAPRAPPGRGQAPGEPSHGGGAELARAFRLAGPSSRRARRQLRSHARRQLRSRHTLRPCLQPLRARPGRCGFRAGTRRGPSGHGDGSGQAPMARLGEVDGVTAAQ
ncbi:hypothetical protein EJB05_27645 [Eragrostis curvula]|uniref:DUF629 domain-containing protein n=1 Tax=Eragrostis curvula TaxID=38414 RepID=A0A5J9UPS4_9POAL|nr:hypothetical protein EJB05_27645 [Eragrostis curvula]